MTVPSALWGCRQAQTPVRSVVSSRVPSSRSTALTRVTYPSSVSGSSPIRSNTRWAPAMAMTMLLVCWLIWLTGWVPFLFRVRKETSIPRVRPPKPFSARIAPTMAHST